MPRIWGASSDFAQLRLGFNIYNNNFIKTVQIYKTESTFFQATKSLLGDQPIMPLLILNQWVGCYLLMLNQNIIDDAYCDLTGRGVRKGSLRPAEYTQYLNLTKGIRHRNDESLLLCC